MTEQEGQRIGNKCRYLNEKVEAARSGQPFTLSGAGWSITLTLASQPERDYTVLFKEMEEMLHVCKEAIADIENRKAGRL